jgi:CheY-like chemotaxis protein
MQAINSQVCQLVPQAYWPPLCLCLNAKLPSVGAVLAFKNFSQPDRASLKLENRDSCQADNVARENFYRPRVLLVDDSPAMRDQVSRTLRANFEIVGSLGSGEEALADWCRIDPDVIVLDISMGALSGIEVARALQECKCRSVIVFLTVHEDPDFIAAAFGAGGAAYVKKGRINLDLVQAIDTALAGGTFISVN